jgi:IBR domain, a half RING-finger domain
LSAWADIEYALPKYTCLFSYYLYFPANPDPAAKESVSRNPTCGICEDHFQEAYSPLSALLSANSSTHLPFGLQLPCPNKHTYCVSCLSQYITSKLDPLGTGRAPEEQIVFPIRCPECPPDEWADGIQDDVAERILTKDRITLWVSKGPTAALRVLLIETPPLQYNQKQLDGHPRYFCPNRKCSALVQLHEQEAGKPQVACSLCKTVMCVQCKTQWHNGKLISMHSSISFQLMMDSSQT